MKPLYFSYYTIDTPYEDEAKRLEASFKKFNLDYHIQPMMNQGSWAKNTHLKPTLINTILESIDVPIVYVDCDAEIVGNPILFNNLNCDIALHEFDRSIYNSKYRQGNTEILSGTLFFNQTERSKQILQQWIKLCNDQMNVWDQKLLAQIIGRNFYQLPASYCCIFDTMKDVENKVIIHYQASRKVKTGKWKL